MSLLIKHNNESMDTATEFTCEVDGYVVSTSEDMIDGFLSYIAAIYIFNLSNPPEVKKTVLFIEKVSLNLEDSERPSNTLMNKSDFRGPAATSTYDFGESNPPMKTMHFNILDNNI